MLVVEFASKVDVPNLTIAIIWTPLFKWYVIKVEAFMVNHVHLAAH